MPNDLPPVGVRLARTEDADDIARLTIQLGYDVTASDVAAKLPRFLARPEQRIFIAECDGHPIGWLHAVTAEFLEMEPCVMIAGLVVDNYYRRRGAGRRLMEYAEAWALEQGCSVVRLWSRSSRTHAHRFYEQLGYSKVKTQYAFAKSIGGKDPGRLARLVPKIP